MVSSIVGNFLAAAIARRIGYKRAIALMAAGLLCDDGRSPTAWPRSLNVAVVVLSRARRCARASSPCSRCTCRRCFPRCCAQPAAGFCYNIGRIAAAAGTVFFGLLSPVGDKRLALLLQRLALSAGRLFALAMPDEDHTLDGLPEPAADLPRPAGAELSAEDRAILEEVYRERGCSG